MGINSIIGLSTAKLSNYGGLAVSKLSSIFGLSPIDGGGSPTPTPTSKLFIAVGDNGGIVTSPDGITWTARTSGLTAPLNAVAADNLTGLICAVGESGHVSKSVGGESWTASLSGDGATMRGVVFDYLSNTFVASSYIYSGDFVDIYAQVSTDGDSWTHNAVKISSTGHPNKITVSPGGLFCLCTDQNLDIYTSPNGTAWTARWKDSSTSLNDCAVNSSGFFCAVGDYRTIITSPDGITWTSITLGGVGEFHSIAVNSSDIFCAVTSDGEVYTSPNGTTWTAQSSGTSTYITTVTADADGNFYFVDYNGGIYQSTNDGVTWAKISNITDFHVNDLAICEVQDIESI